MCKRASSTTHLASSCMSFPFCLDQGGMAEDGETRGVFLADVPVTANHVELTQICQRIVPDAIAIYHRGKRWAVVVTKTREDALLIMDYFDKNYYRGEKLSPSWAQRRLQSDELSNEEAAEEPPKRASPIAKPTASDFVSPPSKRFVDTQSAIQEKAIKKSSNKDESNDESIWKRRTGEFERSARAESVLSHLETESSVTPNEYVEVIIKQAAIQSLMFVPPNLFQLYIQPLMNDLLMQNKAKLVPNGVKH